MEHCQAHRPGSEPRSWAPPRWVTWAAVAAIGFYLITEHRAHLYGALPYLILLVCPLLHFFGHGGHKGHSSDDHPISDSQKEA